jgi:mannosyl-3-phosphoglycerate phosphatase
MRLIVTDIDGTLIDHHTYSAESARPALEAAAAAGVPVVLCSSKTHAEMAVLARALALAPAPLIVENGGAVWWPGGWPSVPAGARPSRDGGQALVLGTPASALQPQVEALARATRTVLRGFSSMTDEEVAARTGLPLDVARLARQREYSEPFVCESGAADLQALEAAAASLGARVTQGGRFFHLLGPSDKGRAVRYVRASCPGLERTLGLGDAPNDLSLLREVDDAVIVPQPHGIHRQLAEALPRATHASAPGPAGWAVAVSDWLGRTGHG